jgi:uncharacterized glyoxalase superfamily protein PhnB
MKPSPKGWPRISSAVFYKDPAKAIDWLCRAFDFQVRIKVVGEGGRIEHSELTYGDGVVMVGGEGASENRPDRAWAASPGSIGGRNTQGLFLYVDDIAAHFARAREAGAKIISEMKVSDYGEEHWADRGYEAADLEGHHWWFAQRLRDPGQ